MNAAKAGAPLERADIDRIVDALTMGDVQAAFEAGTPDKAIGGVAFRRAARRVLGMSNGVDPLDSVRAGDVKYLGEAMQAAMSDANPKSDGTAS